MTVRGLPSTRASTAGERLRLAILGAGVMGETVLSGLLRAGWSPDRIVATDRRPERQVELSERYGIADAGERRGGRGATP